MAEIDLQAQMLGNRLKKRMSHLRKWAKRSDVGAFRLYDRDIPEIPLVLDLYNDGISGALYKRPYEKDEAEETLWLAAMQSAISNVLEIAPDCIFLKQRQRKSINSQNLTQRREGTKDAKERPHKRVHKRVQYEKMAETQCTRIVRENGLSFKVNLSDYLDTGLFLDRRAMRRMAGADSTGKRVLNLFSYTGSFSVYATKGGAVSTDSVDLSNTYQAWARENFALNGFSAEIVRLQDYGTSAHTLIRADVGAFLEAAITARRRWDMIILDPPAFSNSTMARSDFDLRKDYEELLTKCLSLLTPGGKLWFSASARSFKTSAAKLEIALAAGRPGMTVTDIGNAIIDEDFKERKMPRAYVVSVKGK
ncbi:MAG: class I SAM-dependent methyltransferase [Treponema sp.]|nr:class I SAM-dependent methyltransferase [Treponema sp.]